MRSVVVMMGLVSRFSLGLSLVSLLAMGQTVQALPLKPVAPEKLKYVGLDDKLGNLQDNSDVKTIYRWQTNPSCPLAQPKAKANHTWNHQQKQALLEAIDHSLYYLSTPKAQRTYQKYAQTEFNLERTKRSLLRFKELLQTTTSPTALAAAVKQEFAFYQSVGKDQQGKVEFTGYFEPTYVASRVRTPEYTYPLYRQPVNFSHWGKSHPTRTQLEGNNGVAPSNSPLKGRELVWFKDRLEAYLVQVQGSARLNLTDGTTMSVGYHGTTNYPYVSIGGELVKDKVFSKEELSLPKLLNYFEQYPQKLDRYVPRNNRFVFFRETNGKPPTGNLGVPVTGDRSIATDKSLMPPGALALIVAPIPDVDATGNIETRVVSRYVLDQDTGSAIKGAGRVDVFLGSGTTAGERAGRLNGSGNLFYLLLK